MLARALLFAAAAIPAGAAPRAQAVEEGAVPAPAEQAWTFALGVYAFDPPEDDAYLSPILRADRGALHLEARYQYEDRDTASLFVGGNFAFGDEVSLSLVPMIGVALGDTDGVVPAVELDLAWKGLAFYAESEYLRDLHDPDDSFFYTWDELTFAPSEWLRFGLVAQRTRVFEQELEVDRGFLIGLSGGAISFDAYLFNPDQDEPYGGVSIGFGG